MSCRACTRLLHSASNNVSKFCREEKSKPTGLRGLNPMLQAKTVTEISLAETRATQCLRLLVLAPARQQHKGGRGFQSWSSSADYRCHQPVFFLLRIKHKSNDRQRGREHPRLLCGFNGQLPNTHNRRDTPQSASLFLPPLANSVSASWTQLNKEKSKYRQVTSDRARANNKR